MAELLESFESEIKSVTLIPSDGGRFEVTIDGKLVYSKLTTRRHVEPGELKALVEQHIKESK